jgi:hypothetical protein
MKKQSGHVIYSPSDLIRYLASPFASWLDRYYLEELDDIKPDAQAEANVQCAFGEAPTAARELEANGP